MMALPKLGPVVAIDGPAGAGKSSATRRLAEVLGYVHIDTGALYRAVAWLSIQQRVLDPADFNTAKTDEITEIARKAHLEFKRMPKKNPSNRIFGNGVDVTSEIRTPEVSASASWISAIPGVRAALLGLQRRLGCQGKAILEGRDIGTVVFPDADVKFFLTASIEERAKRRLAEMEAAGADVTSFEDVKRSIVERDRGDSERKTAPLRKAKDAIEVDTTSFTLDQVVEQMAKHVKVRLGTK